jgi:TonB family protein
LPPTPAVVSAPAFSAVAPAVPPPHPAALQLGSFEAPKIPARPVAPQRIRQTDAFAPLVPEADRRRDTTLSASAGFEQAAVPPPPSRHRETPAAASFGGPPPTPEAKTRALAAATPFDTARTAAPAPPPSVPRTGVGGFTPVEIISKPRPVYTEDGRSARVEGEITLEVLFAASGKARVLRTLNKLGHGLDESALRAAEEIRFRPATRGGRPEDTIATVRIDFRLAY